VIKTFGLFLLCSVLMAVAPVGSTPVSAPSVTDIRVQEFQILDRDREFETLLSKLDLGSSDYVLEYKKTGTSLGLKVFSGDKSFGKFQPPSASKNPEAQIVAYRLGQFLHMGTIVVPSGAYVLNEGLVAQFHSMLLSVTETQSLRAENQRNLLAAIEKDPTRLAGAFTPHIKKWEVKDLSDSITNTINPLSPIADWIRAEGPMPSANHFITLKGVRVKEKGAKLPTESELELAREFSKILVLDILCGEWDRWSGGNIEATIDPATGRLAFFDRDNGGASLTGVGNIDATLRVVSRFDRGQIKRVERLLEILKGSNAKQLTAALEFKANPKSLVARATALLNQVQTLIGQYGEDQVYFPN
jgi:hypothetical protein